MNVNSLIEEESVKAKAVMASMDERNERNRLAVQASMPGIAMLDGPKPQQGYRHYLRGIRSSISSSSFLPAGGSTVKQVQYLKKQNCNSAAEGEEASNGAGVAGHPTRGEKTCKHDERVIESRSKDTSPPEDAQEAPCTKWKDCDDSSRWNAPKNNPRLGNAM